MGIYRRDYLEQSKRKKVIFAAIIGVIVVAFIFIFIKGKKGDKPLSEKERMLKEFEAKQVQKTESVKEKDVSLPDLIKEVKSAIVKIVALDENCNEIGIGSGFIISQKGVLVTNYHVINNADSLKIKTNYGIFNVEEFIDKDRKHDLAVLQINLGTSKSKPLTLSDRKPQVGERIFVIGSPLGLEATVSDGIVSANREVPGFGRVIQITSPISPGSSGSPLFDFNGKVIGVATFQVIEGQNLNFAIPIAWVKKLKATEPVDLKNLGSPLDRDLQKIDSNFEKGAALFESKNYKKAKAYFKKTISMEPDNAKAYFYIGVCLREEGKIRRAVDQLNMAIDLSPDDPRSHYELGNTYAALNMLQDSIHSFEKSIELDSNLIEAKVKLGAIYLTLNQGKKAVRVLKDAADYGIDAKAFYYLGLSHVLLKNYGEAIQALEDATSLDPDFIDAYIGLGQTLILVKNWSYGVKMMNKGLLIAPDNPFLHVLKGIHHLGKNELNSAQIELEILNNLKDWKKLSKKQRKQYDELISKFRRMIDAYKNMRR